MYSSKIVVFVALALVGITNANLLAADKAKVSVTLPNNGGHVTAGDNTVTVSVTGGAANTTYTVQVSITNNTTSSTGTLVTGTITTDASGNGSVSVTATGPAGNSGDKATVHGREFHQRYACERYDDYDLQVVVLFYRGFASRHS